MPNYFAYILILTWPLISLFIYRKLAVLPATFITIVGGYLLLPTRTVIDFALIPPIDKESITALSALLGCSLIKKININFIPKTGSERWLVLLFIILPIFTVITNTEPVYDGRYWRQALTFRDALSGVATNYLKILPFIISLQLIKTYDDQILILKYFSIAGLLYTLPVLFEIRMSPQLHTWIYGFFPHVFGQQMRGDGFRAVVFLGHGLLVATFLLVTLASTAILWKKRIGLFGIHSMILISYLAVVLLLSKTLGAVILALIIIPAIILLSSKMINNLSRLLMLVIFLYPSLVLFKIFPHQEIIELITKIDVNRASSLAYRFNNETILLDHATEKLLFGWGGWDRNRPWGTVTDGYWIVVFGVQGLLGFIAIFGLPLLASIKAFKATTKLSNSSQREVLSMNILLVVVLLIDQLPNASMSGYIMLLTGMLLGRANMILQESRVKFKY